MFAERGLASVSMREIARQSGSRNVIAGQYWFGDKAGLVRALLGKHAVEVEARRHAMLDVYETSGDRVLYPLAAKMVRPLGANSLKALPGPDTCGSSPTCLLNQFPRSPSHWGLMTPTAVCNGGGDCSTASSIPKWLRCIAVSSRFGSW